MAGKGNPKGVGRPPGIPNKVTSDARAAIAKFVDGNAHRLQGWLDQIAEGVPKKDKDGLVMVDKDGKILWEREPNPQRAFELFQSVVEYHVPKLARSEITGADGQGLTIVVKRFSDLPPGEQHLLPMSKPALEHEQE